ncbi:MAG: hypothetical protein K0Q71_2946 [Thermomicrobiales bacterium]|jgi:hypothetical protein|nr:hypothetical protein [Thermomicrobiales bacterium]
MPCLTPRARLPHKFVGGADASDQTVTTPCLVQTRPMRLQRAMDLSATGTVGLLETTG